MYVLAISLGLIGTISGLRLPLPRNISRLQISGRYTRNEIATECHKATLFDSFIRNAHFASSSDGFLIKKAAPTHTKNEIDKTLHADRNDAGD